jgi:restriction endonuclease
MKNKEEIENAINIINQNLQKLEALWRKNNVQKWIDFTIQNENNESIPVEDVDLAYELSNFGENLKDIGKEWGQD